jgi:hypothetical protein
MTPIGQDPIELRLAEAVELELFVDEPTASRPSAFRGATDDLRYSNQ